MAANYEDANHSKRSSFLLLVRQSFLSSQDVCKSCFKYRIVLCLMVKILVFMPSYRCKMLETTSPKQIVKLFSLGLQSF